MLEIGPLNRPLVSGPNVLYADHCSTEELRAKYAGNPDVPPDQIRQVHIDLSRTSLRDAAPAGSLDVVVASHVIEHVPDLIGWLDDISHLLAPGGVLALVVPDKRYTFDVFRRETEPWMVEQSRGNKRPSLRQVIEHFTNIVSADTGAIWANGNAISGFRPAIDIGALEDLFQKYRNGNYIDAHCWIFTPDSFVKIIDEIDTPLKLQSLLPTMKNQLEFYAQLRKSHSDPNATR